MVKKNIHKGRRCFILGTGTSLLDHDLSPLKNEITIGVNQIAKKFIPNYLCVSDTLCLNRNEGDIINKSTENSDLIFVKYNGAGSELKKHQSRVASRIVNFVNTGNKYYIDHDLINISPKGGSVVQDLAIPLAVHIGVTEIYLLGCDGGYRHFFDPSGNDGIVKQLESQYGKYRRLQKWGDVIEETNKLGVEVYTCYKGNIFKELEYKNYEELFKEK